MFDSLIEVAAGASDAAAVGAWARLENAACARRLSAAADVLDRLYAASGSAERDQWIHDNWSAVAAEIAPTQNVSLGMAAHQLEVAVTLRDRLPRVNAAFLTGAITYRMVAAIVTRTGLILDSQALRAVDAAIADHVAVWTTLSLEKLREKVDYWIDRFDPAAVRRAENNARSRYIDVKDSGDGSGVAYLDGVILTHDGELIDQRLEALAATVCENDPRTVDQRRADAMPVAMTGADTLPCACGSEDCPAASTTAGNVIVHVVANQDTVDDATPAELDGHKPTQTIDPADPTLGGPADTGPGYVMGSGAIVPAPVVADKLAGARRRPVVHPGDAPPEKRRIPTAVLAWFIRCRDLTCRFPGCHKPATHRDIDHTIPYPRGATQASNLKCLCAAPTTCSRLSGAGAMFSIPTARWTGSHRVGSPTPPIRAAGCCSPPCACPPHPPSSTTVSRSSTMWCAAGRCRAANEPAPKPARTPSTPNAAPTSPTPTNATNPRPSRTRRVARFGSGWSPSLTAPDQFPARIDFIKSQPRYDGRPFEVFYGLGSSLIGKGHQVIEDPTQMPGMTAELGVTATGVPIPPVADVDAYLDYAQWVIEEIRPKVP